MSPSTPTVYTEAGPSTLSKAPVTDEQSPSNLRFQRRQSERAFVESSYRERPMDYSSAAGSGQSPWASSPDASRTSFQGHDGVNVPRVDMPGPAVQDGQEGYGHGQQYAQQGSPEQQKHQQQWNEQGRVSVEEGRRPQSARYHGVPPQHQQRHMPQYKLQAKITGLERVGKKDPILRFDVYVCCVDAC